MIDRADKETLLALPAFKRFMFWLIETGGVFDAASAGADHRFADGRRSLVLEVLRELEAAQAARHDSGIPVLTSIQLLHEAMQTAVKNTQPGRVETYGELSYPDE